MSDVWNDCPLCGGELTNTRTRKLPHLLCGHCEKYQLAMALGGFIVECIEVCHFEVSRDKFGTRIRAKKPIIYHDSELGDIDGSIFTEVLNVPTVLEFERFNTEEKIKSLLVFS